ncbi:MAG: FAD:protein FMN transferase, partial [Clostridia bacterium]
DPSTGLPVQNELASVTVICDDGALSDALSTTCFVLGIKKSLPVLRHYNSEALFVTNNGDIYATSDAKKVFVSEQNVKNANEY